MVSQNLKNLKIRYDDSADVLYISFGDPRPAIAIEVNVGDLVRIDPSTREVVGITILDFKERYILPSPLVLEDSVKIIIPKILEQYLK